MGEESPQYNSYKETSHLQILPLSQNLYENFVSLQSQWISAVILFSYYFFRPIHKLTDSWCNTLVSQSYKVQNPSNLLQNPNCVTRRQYSALQRQNGQLPLTMNVNDKIYSFLVRKFIILSANGKKVDSVSRSPGIGYWTWQLLVDIGSWTFGGYTWPTTSSISQTKKFLCTQTFFQAASCKAQSIFQ